MVEPSQVPLSSIERCSWTNRASSCDVKLIDSRSYPYISYPATPPFLHIKHRASSSRHTNAISIASQVSVDYRYLPLQHPTHKTLWRTKKSTTRASPKKPQNGTPTPSTWKAPKRHSKPYSATSPHSRMARVKVRKIQPYPTTFRHPLMPNHSPRRPRNRLWNRSPLLHPLPQHPISRGRRHSRRYDRRVQHQTHRRRQTKSMCD